MLPKKRLPATLSIILLILIIGPTKIMAQESDFYAQYFQNAYLTNPAMAGLEKGLDFNLGYQQPFTSVPGSLKMQYLTVGYSAGNNVGLGLNVYNESLGLISDTRLVLTYAYHIPFNEENKLNFGLSLGFNDTYINYNQIVGDQGDLSVNRYNQQPVYIDGDFGASYTSNQLTVQAALPNLKSLLFGNKNQDLQTDMSVFLASVKYKIILENDVNNFDIEPITAYHAIRGVAGIFSTGLNFNVPEYDFNVSGMYFTNKSATFAFGLDLGNLGLLLAYSDDLSSLKTANTNTFEIGLKFNFLNK